MQHMLRIGEWIVMPDSGEVVRGVDVIRLEAKMVARRLKTTRYHELDMAGKACLRTL